VNGNAATIFTYAYVYSENAGLAIHDVISNLSLSRGKLIAFLVNRIKAVKYILDGCWTFTVHDSPPSGSSNGLRMPRRVLLLTCKYTSVERESTCPRRD
jgi:hypothetical protein